MKNRYWFLCFSLLLAPSAQANDYLEGISDKHILPGYQRLANSTAVLAQSIDTFCEQPSLETLDTTKESYKTAFIAWQGAQHVRFGPIKVLLREHRYQLWPDKRGSVGKHLSRFLAANDMAKLNKQDFPEISVSLQGFSVLERLLYSNKARSTTKNDLSCQLLQSVGQNLALMSQDLYREWSTGKDNYRAFVITADQGNTVFEELSEFQSILLNNLYTELQLVAEQKFERPLGSSLKKAKSKRAEMWRSQLSNQAIIKNLQSSKQLYEVAFQPLLKQQIISSEIQKAFYAAIAATMAISMPLDQAVKDNISREQVLIAQKSVHKLKRLIGSTMAEKLSLSVGFNSLDGD